MQVTFKILRYNPEKDNEPHFEEYRFEGHENMTVLDCLHKIKWEHDGSLAFRRSCAHGVCVPQNERVHKGNGQAPPAQQRYKPRASGQRRGVKNHIQSGRFVTSSRWHFGNVGNGRFRFSNGFQRNKFPQNLAVMYAGGLRQNFFFLRKQHEFQLPGIARLYPGLYRDHTWINATQ